MSGFQLQKIVDQLKSMGETRGTFDCDGVAVTIEIVPKPQPAPVAPGLRFFSNLVRQNFSNN